jgi:hypothetical protein
MNEGEIISFKMKGGCSKKGMDREREELRGIVYRHIPPPQKLIDDFFFC